MNYLHLPKHAAENGLKGFCLLALLLALLATGPITSTFGQANHAPVAGNVSASVSGGWNSWHLIDPLAGTDAEGEALSYRIVSLPSLADGSRVGSLSLGSTGNSASLAAGQVVSTARLYFKPGTKDTGIAVSFSYTAIDPKGNESAPAVYTVYIGLTPVPSAVSKIARAISNLGDQAEVTLEAKGGTVVGYRLVTQPPAAQGRLSLRVAGVPLDLPVSLAGFIDLLPAQASQLVFTPDPSFVGVASFTYVAGDASPNARMATAGGRNARYSAPATYYIPVDAPSPLPIELTGFSASAGKTGVTLGWGTASEQDNDYFQVERSADGKEFTGIGRVKGHGTSAVALAYSFTDAAPLGGTSYYRLRQVDFDGGQEYSKVVAVKVGQAPAVSLEAYPNPTEGKVTLDLAGSPEGPVTVTLLQGDGRLVSMQRIGEGQSLTLDLSGLAPGVYYAQAQSAAGKTTVRVVKR